MDAIKITDEIIEKKSHRKTCKDNIKYFSRLIEEREEEGLLMYSKYIKDNREFQWKIELDNWRARLEYVEEDIKDLRLKLKFPNW